jgi:hypothetical protein
MGDRQSFRDWLLIDLFTDVLNPPGVEDEWGNLDEDEDEVERGEDALDPILETATASMRAVVDPGYEGAWVVQWDATLAGEPVRILDIVEPEGDVVAAYQRLTAGPARGWVHGEDEQHWPFSVDGATR